MFAEPRPKRTKIFPNLKQLVGSMPHAVLLRQVRVRLLVYMQDGLWKLRSNFYERQCLMESKICNFYCTFQTKNQMTESQVIRGVFAAVKNQILFKWFNANFVKVNGHSSPLLITGNKKVIANIGIKCIESKAVHEFLDITTDSKLALEKCIDEVYKKASQKSISLAGISNYMVVDKRKKIMEAFITSQFCYCQLVWMFHSKRLGKK